MQHNNETSFLGVADIGDLLLVQAASPGDVVTYVEGRARGEKTYEDFGDVIVFHRPTHVQAVLHRPLLRLLWNPTLAGFDIPSLLELERGVDWDSSRPTPRGLVAGDSVILFNVTSRAIPVTITMDAFVRDIVASRCVLENPCYVTMGDNNAPIHDQFLIRHSWVLGRARGEIPWLGLLKLGLDGTYAWGDPRVASNSWTFLMITLMTLVGSSLGLQIMRWRRLRRREEPELDDEGGLGGVLSNLEQRWNRSGEAKNENLDRDDAKRQIEESFEQKEEGEPPGE